MATYSDVTGYIMITIPLECHDRIEAAFFSEKSGSYLISNAFLWRFTTDANGIFCSF